MRRCVIIMNPESGKVKKLEIYTKPANLQKYLGQTLESYDRDIKRAEVVKKIINAHNEEILCRSSLGQGTEFEFTLEPGEDNG